jgi:hypothetical protein
MGIELFENKAEGFFIIRDGASVLKLSAADFEAMRKSGMSPLLRRLWDAAKKERDAGKEKSA